MTYIKNILLGSGMSSLVYFSIKKEKLKVITGDDNKILKSKNFYEYEAFGGNSNIWGGYINFIRHKRFLENRKYNEIFSKKLFKVKKYLMMNPILLIRVTSLIKIKIFLELKERILKIKFYLIR